MLRQLLQLVGLAMVAASFHGAALGAEQRATREEAVALVKKAVATIQKSGKEKAFAAFHKPDGPFIVGDLYIIALDLNGVMLANGIRPKLVGKSLFDLRDVSGKYFVREEIALARSKGKGWVDFEWLNPAVNQMEPRSTYFELVDDYIVGAGVYQSR